MKVIVLFIAGVMTAGVAGLSYHYHRLAQGSPIVLSPTAKPRFAQVRYVAQTESGQAYGDLSMRLAWHAAWCAALTVVLAVWWRSAFRTLTERFALMVTVLIATTPLAGLWYLGLLQLY